MLSILSRWLCPHPLVEPAHHLAYSYTVRRSLRLKLTQHAARRTSSSPKTATRWIAGLQGGIPAIASEGPHHLAGLREACEAEAEEGLPFVPSQVSYVINIKMISAMAGLRRPRRPRCCKSYLNLITIRSDEGRREAYKRSLPRLELTVADFMAGPALEPPKGG